MYSCFCDTYDEKNGRKKSNHNPEENKMMQLWMTYENWMWMIEKYKICTIEVFKLKNTLSSLEDGEY